jgi:hypothetical protein
MTLEELCALRDKLIMDNNYSQEEQTFMYGLFQREIAASRNGLTIIVE